MVFNTLAGLGSKMAVSLRSHFSVYPEMSVNSGPMFRAPEEIYPAKIYQILTAATWVNLEQVLCCTLLQKTVGRGPKNLSGRSPYSGQNSDIPWFLLFLTIHKFRIFRI